jgi:uncharacterized membrane protein
MAYALGRSSIPLETPFVSVVWPSALQTLVLARLSPATTAGRKGFRVAIRDRKLNATPTTVLAALLIVIGTALRVYLYLQNPSPWLDEQQLAVNIASRSFTGLVRELDFAQSAPLLFLWMIRLVVAFAGVNELALRAVPLTVGLLLLPASWLFARRLFSEREALLTVTLVALSPVLIRYSNEIKPYGLDALVAIGLVWLALNCQEATDEKRPWMLLAFGGVTAVWLSTTAAFVLAGIGVSFLLQFAIGRRWRQVIALVVCCSLWLASFAVAYVEIYRAPARNGYMQRFWAGSFLHLSLLDGTRQLFDMVGGMISAIFLHRDVFGGAVAPARYLYTGVILLLCLVGALRCWRERGAQRTGLLILPFLIAIGASAAQLYPLSVRLMLFAAPAFLVFTAAGVALVLKTEPLVRSRILCTALVMFLLLPSVAHAAIELRHSDRRELARTVIARLQSTASDSSPAYILSSGLAAWLLYTTDWGAPDTARLAWLTHMARQPGGPISYNAPSRLRPVHNEGDDYQRWYNRRREIYGMPSGMEETSTRFPVAPDPGWAENEARRIVAAARPCVWLVAVHYHQRELDELVRALKSRGLTSFPIEQLTGAALVRSCIVSPH